MFFLSFHPSKRCPDLKKQKRKQCTSTGFHQIEQARFLWQPNLDLYVSLHYLVSPKSVIANVVIAHFCLVSAVC